MPDVLLISKPIAPPWNDSNKNLVRDLSRGMTRWRPRVLVPRGEALDGVLSEPVYQSRGAYAPARSANVRVLGRLLLGPRTAVWHFFFGPNPTTLRAGALASGLRRVPTVHTVASAPDDLERLTFFADRVVVLSEHTRQRLRHLGDRVVKIPPAVTAPPVEPSRVEEARRRHGLPARYVLYPGDLEFSRGAETFVRAASLGRRPWVWVVASRPKTHRAREALGRLQALARDQGAELTWLGELDDILAVVAGASALALPVETLHAKMDWPLVLLEALSYGVPCVVGAGTAAAELEASGGVTVVPSGSPEALVHALEALLGDAPATARRALEAQRWVRATCAPAVVARACEALYDEVC